MRTSPAIPATATVTVEFIPPSQNHERYKLLEGQSIRDREQVAQRKAAEIEERQAAGEYTAEQYEAAVAALQDVIDLIEIDRQRFMHNYESMKERFPEPMIFILNPPTPVERDQINSRLVSLGLKQVPQELIRATMVDELFHQDWSEPGEELTAAENEARADELATFLDSIWLRQEAHDEATERWKEQEIERILDAAHGAPEREAEEAPPKIITVREQAKMQILIDRMMTTSQRLRDLASANMDFGRRNAVLLVRMHLVGVVGMNPPLPIARDPRTRALPDAVVDALRNELDDTTWVELCSEIDSMYVLTEADKKNSDSLPEKLPLRDGSTEPSEKPEGSDGTSTVSYSTPPLADVFETITDKSFNSISVSDMAPGLKEEKDSLTGGL